MVCTRMQQCFLSYYSIFLPLKDKGSLQGKATMSPESPYQVLMITQIPVSFENRWIFCLFVLPYSCSCGNVPPPFDLHLVFPDVLQKYIRGVFFFPCEEILLPIYRLGDFASYFFFYFIS